MTENNNFNFKYYQPIMRLADLCEREGISFTVRPLFDGLQLLCPSLKEKEFDVICHSYSYGHEQGELEVMGAICNSDDDNVEGYLTVEEVFERIKKYYKKENYNNTEGYSTVEEIFDDIRKCYKKGE